MAELAKPQPDWEALPAPIVSYAPSAGTIFIKTGAPLIEGEEIAEGITVFYKGEDDSEVVGIMINGAEVVLKPFVDAILAKYGKSKPVAGEA